MLQLFKKSGRTVSCDDKTPDNKSVSSQSSSNNDALLIDDDLSEDLIESRSKLSINLIEIITDKNCLSYFVQFLETKKALSLIKFYLDAESFKTATEISLVPLIIGTKNQQSDTASDDYYQSHPGGREMNKSFSSEGYDSLSYTSFEICDRISICSQTDNETIRLTATATTTTNNNNNNQNDESPSEILYCENKSEMAEVPELKILCDLSMRKPLTDDEKSQIVFAESNKRKCGENFSAKPTVKSSNSTVATDAIRIYRKYLTLNSPYFIDIPAMILSNISLALCANKDSSGDGNISTFSITSSCFEEAQKYILERLENEYLNEFLRSSFYCKYCIDILTSPGLCLSDILHSESSLFYFMEYLEQENQRDCLEFWMAATNFRKHYTANMNNDNDKNEATKDAMILYEKYFSLQSPCPLKFSDRVRSRVEECICGESSQLVISSFNLPLKIIEKHIESKYFQSFVNSQLFMNYLTELRSKIITDHMAFEWQNSLRKHSHRKTRSDCTAESIKGVRRNSFISQQNTLLAMESTKSSKSNKVAVADMQIDCRHLTNPDLLWYRKSTGGLTFGKVNSLGRYERDFDLGCPDEKWSLASGGNKIKNAVRKLVNLPEDKVQEEIAWQVAEMIVKDITSITLGKNHNNYNNNSSS